MKRFALICGLALLVSVAASAQNSPKAEVFGGYSFLHVSDQGVTANFNGGSGSVSFNPSSSLGIVGDFGGYKYSKGGGSLTTITYLFGPKFAYRAGRVTPFVQVLFGGAHVGAGAYGAGTASASAFAWAVGGGMDANVTPHIGIRLVQAEYLMSKFKDGANNRQNNVRVSTGIVFRF